MNLTRSFSAVLLMTLTGMASAQVQKCTDANGKVSYSDVACPHNAPKKKSLGIPSLSNNYEPSSPVQSLSAANDGFNQRQAQRDQNAIAEAKVANQKELIKAVNAPPPPGYTKSTTIVPLN